MCAHTNTSIITITLFESINLLLRNASNLHSRTFARDLFGVLDVFEGIIKKKKQALYKPISQTRRLGRLKTRVFAFLTRHANGISRIYKLVVFPSCWRWFVVRRWKVYNNQPIWDDVQLQFACCRRIHFDLNRNRKKHSLYMLIYYMVWAHNWEEGNPNRIYGVLGGGYSA